jgi:peroxiredoxin Q/BCP
MTLTPHTLAPQFTAPDQDGVQHSLSDYAGQWVLLYFYPKDDSPGCTIEACNFRDGFELLKKFVTILGVSTDNVESHKAFAEKYGLPFTLLADTEKTITEAYGANGMIFKKRISFLINPKGQIEKIYDNVNVKTHAIQILKDVQNLTE